MAKIIIKLNNDVLDHIDLKQGDMKIGRKPGCEIHVDNLSVSGEHANIFTVGEDSFIQDLGSTNGTFINNKKITKHHLKNGDTVMIGKHSLIYFTDSARAGRPPEEFAKTVIINPSRTVEPRPAAAPATTEAAANTLETKPKESPKVEVERRRVGAIFVLSGLNSGKRIDLTRKITNLGSAGKLAGTIMQTTRGFTLSPGADETPKLNGRLIPSEGTKLKNGDVIEVAGTRLQFYLK